MIRRIHSVLLLVLIQHLTAMAAGDASQLVINEVMVGNVEQFLSPMGNFDGWIELYNPTDEPISLASMFVSDNPDNPRRNQLSTQTGDVPAHGFFVLWFTENELTIRQARFKLDTDGGTVCLSDRYGKPLIIVNYPAANPRLSYARTTDGGDEWAWTDAPTPGQSNTLTTYPTGGQLQRPVVDTPSQVFDDVMDLHIDIPEGAILRYTTDGSLPTLTNGNTSADGHFHLTVTTSLRLRFFREGFLASQPTSCSYLLRTMPIDDGGHTVGDLTLPIVSIVGDERFFYDDSIGVMVQGVMGKRGTADTTLCNWNRDWPRPVSFAYLNTDGSRYEDEALLEISGGVSRGISPHPFKLKGNKLFGGGKTLDYPFFAAKPFIRNRTLQLRNGYTDSVCTLKDAILQTLVQTSGIDIDLQSYQPVVHFINGQYKGFMRMHEPSNKHYVYANYGWGDDEIDFFQNKGHQIPSWRCGNSTEFYRMCGLSTQAADDEVYNQIRQIVDEDEMINYFATRIYLGGTDWVRNNVKGFRRHDGGRFRFVLFDLDDVFVTSRLLDGWFPAQRSESRLVDAFMNLLENEHFRRKFTDTYCLVGANVLEPNRCEPIINREAARVEHDLALENDSPYPIVSHIKQRLRSFAQLFPDVLQRFEPLRLTETQYYKLRLQTTEEPVAIRLNDVEIPHAHYDGCFFPPAVLHAQVAPGLLFMGWKDADSGELLTMSVDIELPHRDITLIPLVRQREQTGATVPVVVNEVSAANDSYVNDYFKKNDWIELYNTTSQSVDVAGMYLSDDENEPDKYRIPDGLESLTTIPAYGHLVLWADRLDTRSQLHAPFKLSASGGMVMLTAADGSWTSRLPYPIHDATCTVGRFPDGGTALYLMTSPTVGVVNRLSAYSQRIVDSEATSLSAAAITDCGLSLTVAEGMLRVACADQPSSSVHLSICNAQGMTLAATSVSLSGGTACVPLSSSASAANGGIALPPHGCFIVRATAADGRTATLRLAR